MTTPKTRRNFLRDATAATAAVAIAGIACAAEGAQQAADTAGTPGQSGGTMGPHDTATHSAEQRAAEEMDRLHEAGVRAFPAKTAGLGNQLVAPRMEGDVKVYDLTCKVVQWETEPGKRVTGWAYNGIVPGPQIRVTQGDRVRVNVKNELPESTSVHFHGLELPNDQDGVPFITQPPIRPGQSYTYEFTVPNAGSHMYHSHHNAAKQVALGLLGAFVVQPRRLSAHDRVDVDYVMILNDGAHGYTINGKGFPATEPIVARRGQRVRIRFMNEGMMIHPMHLHGMHMTVVAKDGWDLPAAGVFRCDTLNIAPGERWDVVVNCTNPGTWAFHCHILPHAESQHGMFGMVTALIVQ
jgi:manganese oxidase